MAEPRTETAVIVSTSADRGQFRTADFASDSDAVQGAYDEMVSRDDLPRTLVLDAPGRPFELSAPLLIWQSGCRIASTGGPTIVPAPGYTGPLIESEIRPSTERGEDGLICNVVIENLWLDGLNRATGIKLKHIQLSTIHSIHVRNTDGPGLWLSDFCIENLFSDLVLSDECGNEEYPALLIQPESSRHPDGGSSEHDIGNITVNSTGFSGTMIHFPANDALRICAGPAEVSRGRRHRKIRFAGCFFHSHGRATKPLVTLDDAYELSFIGTQMLLWRDEGTVMQLGSPGARWPTGITMVSHCIFGAKADSESVGIHAQNVVTDSPCLAAFGNSFGSDESRLLHAVDWGAQSGKQASWASNAVNVTGAAHVGDLPSDSDVLPFAGDR